MTPSLGKLRQEECCEFEDSLNYIVRTCHKKQNKTEQNKERDLKIHIHAHMCNMHAYSLCHCTQGSVLPRASANRSTRPVALHLQNCESK